MLIINGVSLSINQKIEVLLDKIARELGITTQEIKEYKIAKRSLDARKKNKIIYVYNVIFLVENEDKYLANNVKKYIEPTKEIAVVKSDKTVAVIGYGPAGIFAAYNLALSGVNVEVFERGERVKERVKSVNNFLENGKLNTESNVQFGEGGAGTFSDGKLTARTKNPLINFVYKTFVEAGANSEISFVHNPHIGTDVLRKVVKNIRIKTIGLGAKIHFNSKVEKFNYINDKISSITVNGEERVFDDYILAIGHSARDTFEELKNINCEIKPKPFAVGFRIEHKQKMINKSQYKEMHDHPKLGAAEYRLKLQSSEGRGVYTFCMCPGGVVIPSQSEIDTVVVNGMSEFARNKKNANSAVLVTVGPEDIKGDDPLKMMYFQRDLEKKAFELGGSNYHAPVQLVRDYLRHTKSTALGEVVPSYQIGTTNKDLNLLFPGYVNKALHQALRVFDHKIKGFSKSDAVITGVESRSSSPIWIMRERESYNSLTYQNLYPCGEGAGFAGGITSSAIDGLKVSDIIIEKYLIK